MSRLIFFLIQLIEQLSFNINEQKTFYVWISFWGLHQSTLTFKNISRLFYLSRISDLPTLVHSCCLSYNTQLPYLNINLIMSFCLKFLNCTLNKIQTLCYDWHTLYDLTWISLQWHILLFFTLTLYGPVTWASWQKL